MTITQSVCTSKVHVTDIGPDIRGDLRRLAVERVPEGAPDDFEVTPYVDHKGEDAVRALRTFWADAFDNGDRLSLMSDPFDSLRHWQLDLFPYATFLREGEAARAILVLSRRPR